MINRLARFATFAAIVAFTTLGCAKPLPAPPRIPEVAKIEPAPKPTVTSYTLDLSGGWVLVEATPMEGDEPQRIAEYTFNVTDELAFATYIVAMKLDENQPTSTFYKGMIEAANSRDENEVKVVGQRMVKHGEHEGYEVLEARKLEGGIALVLSVAVTDGKVGYLASCGGNITHGEEVIAACKPLIKSFRIGK